MWGTDGWNAVDVAKRQKIRTGKAKNVILFVGDGMSNATIAAARVFDAQQRRGESGEENRFSFENFPFTALSRTYSVNQQTSDSAPKMTAIITGVKICHAGCHAVGEAPVKSVRIEPYEDRLHGYAGRGRCVA